LCHAWRSPPPRSQTMASWCGWRPPMGHPSPSQLLHLRAWSALCASPSPGVWSGPHWPACACTSPLRRRQRCGRANAPASPSRCSRPRRARPVVLVAAQTPGASRWVDRLAGMSAPSPSLLAACRGNPVLASILQARGIGAEAAATLLADPPAVPADPFLLPGVDRAVACLRDAARQRQVCAIVGDFDCDGLGGTALLAEGLGALGLEVRTLLPHRLRDGYGLATHHVEALAAEGIRMLMTV